MNYLATGKTFLFSKFCLLFSMEHLLFTKQLIVGFLIYWIISSAACQMLQKANHFLVCGEKTVILLEKSIVPDY